MLSHYCQNFDRCASRSFDSVPTGRGCRSFVMRQDPQLMGVSSYQNSCCHPSGHEESSTQSKRVSQLIAGEVIRASSSVVDARHGQKKKSHSEKKKSEKRSASQKEERRRRKKEKQARKREREMTYQETSAAVSVDGRASAVPIIVSANAPNMVIGGHIYGGVRHGQEATSAVHFADRVKTVAQSALNQQEAKTPPKFFLENRGQHSCAPEDCSSETPRQSPGFDESAQYIPNVSTIKQTCQSLAYYETMQEASAKNDGFAGYNASEKNDGFAGYNGTAQSPSRGSDQHRADTDMSSILETSFSRARLVQPHFELPVEEDLAATQRLIQGLEANPVDFPMAHSGAGEEPQVPVPQSDNETSLSARESRSRTESLDRTVRRRGGGGRIAESKEAQRESLSSSSARRSGNDRLRQSRDDECVILRSREIPPRSQTMKCVEKHAERHLNQVRRCVTVGVEQSGAETPAFVKDRRISDRKPYEALSESSDKAPAAASATRHIGKCLEEVESIVEKIYAANSQIKTCGVRAEEMTARIEKNAQDIEDVYQDIQRKQEQFWREMRGMTTHLVLGTPDKPSNSKHVKIHRRIRDNEKGDLQEINLFGRKTDQEVMSSSLDSASLTSNNVRNQLQQIVQEATERQKEVLSHLNNTETNASSASAILIDIINQVKTLAISSSSVILDLTKSVERNNEDFKLEQDRFRTDFQTIRSEKETILGHREAAEAAMHAMSRAVKRMQEDMEHLPKGQRSTDPPGNLKERDNKEEASTDSSQEASDLPTVSAMQNSDTEDSKLRGGSEKAKSNTEASGDDQAVDEWKTQSPTASPSKAQRPQENQQKEQKEHRREEIHQSTADATSVPQRQKVSEKSTIRRSKTYHTFSSKRGPRKEAVTEQVRHSRKQKENRSTSWSQQNRTSQELQDKEKSLFIPFGVQPIVEESSASQTPFPCSPMSLHFHTPPARKGSSSYKDPNQIPESLRKGPFLNQANLSQDMGRVPGKPAFGVFPEKYSSYTMPLSSQVKVVQPGMIASERIITSNSKISPVNSPPTVVGPVSSLVASVGGRVLPSNGLITQTTQGGLIPSVRYSSYGAAVPMVHTEFPGNYVSPRLQYRTSSMSSMGYTTLRSGEGHALVQPPVTSYVPQSLPRSDSYVVSVYASPLQTKFPLREGINNNISPYGTGDNAIGNNGIGNISSYGIGNNTSNAMPTTHMASNLATANMASNLATANMAANLPTAIMASNLPTANMASNLPTANMANISTTNMPSAPVSGINLPSQPTPNLSSTVAASTGAVTVAGFGQTPLVSPLVNTNLSVPVLQADTYSGDQSASHHESGTPDPSTSGLPMGEAAQLNLVPPSISGDSRSGSGMRSSPFAPPVKMGLEASSFQFLPSTASSIASMPPNQAPAITSASPATTSPASRTYGAAVAPAVPSGVVGGTILNTMDSHEENLFYSLESTATAIQRRYSQGPEISRGFTPTSASQNFGMNDRNELEMTKTMRVPTQSLDAVTHTASPIASPTPAYGCGAIQEENSQVMAFEMGSHSQITDFGERISRQEPPTGSLRRVSYASATQSISTLPAEMGEFAGVMPAYPPPLAAATRSPLVDVLPSPGMHPLAP